MKYIALAFGKLLFYMGIPFTLLLLYVLYTNTISEYKSEKFKISFVDAHKAHKNSSTLIPELNGFNERNEKGSIVFEKFYMKKLQNEDLWSESLKYLLPDNRIIGIGSIVDVWHPPIGGYYIKYENESYMKVWFRINVWWLMGLLILNLYPLSLLIKMIFRRKSTLP